MVTEKVAYCFIVDIQSGTPLGEIEFIVIHENTGL